MTGGCERGIEICFWTVGIAMTPKDEGSEEIDEEVEEEQVADFWGLELLIRGFFKSSFIQWFR